MLIFWQMFHAKENKSIEHLPNGFLIKDLKYIENLQKVISGTAFLNQALDKIIFGSKLGQKPKNWTFFAKRRLVM